VSELLLAAAILGGAGATYLFDDDASLPARLCIGTPLGIVGLGLVGYVLGWALGLSMATAVAAAAIVALVPLLIVRRRGGLAAARQDLDRARAETLRALRHPTRGAVATVVFYALMALLVARLLDRAMFEAPEGGGVFTGVDHNLGDLPFHLAIATSFRYGHNFPAEHPELAGTRLTYPFVVDLVVAMLMAAGATARRAIRAENIVLGWALLGLLHRFALRVSRDRLAALLAPMLVLASGGLGFLGLARDVDPLAGGLVGLLRRPTHDYTILAQGPLRWGNIVITMLIPQRSFLLGMPLFLVVATLWWQAITDADRVRARRRLLGAGAIMGLMPLAHAHAFITLLAIAFALAVLFPDARGWARGLGLAIAAAIPQVLLIAQGTSLQSSRFVGWHVGWDRAETGVLRFWWLNLGLFIPALLVALVWRGQRPLVEKTLLRFYVPFALCFLVPNLVRLSPWIWDNIKFMIWWHIVSSVLIALLLARLWRSGWRGRAAAGTLFVLLTLSGSLDLWRAAAGKIVLSIIPPEGTAFAQDIIASTPPRAVVLHAPTYNSEVYLTGRRTIMGYLGHIWSQGLDAGSRERDLEKVYGGYPASGEILARYGVDYIVEGPHERALDAFDDRALSAFPVVVERGPYRLFRVR
jgi:hypothetical protein